MVEFMEVNRDLATNKLVSSQYKSKSNALWNDLTIQLNAEGPPVRDLEVWKKVWKDVKYYTSSKVAFNKKGNNKTGGGKFKPKIITELEERIIGICKLRTRADGIRSCKSYGIEMDVPPISQSEIEDISFTTNPNFEEYMEAHIEHTMDNISENYDIECPTYETDNTQTDFSRRHRSKKSTQQMDHTLLLKKQIENQTEFTEAFKNSNSDKIKILKEIRNEMKSIRKLKEKEVNENLKYKQREEKRADELHKIKLEIKKIELQNLMGN